MIILKISVLFANGYRFRPRFWQIKCTNMLGKLIRLGLLVIVVILGYNYFFGDEQEQAASKKIFGQVKEVVVSVKDLLKSEKEKFNTGKYDKALAKLGEAYKRLQSTVSQVDKDLLKRIGELEKRRRQLQSELNQVKDTSDADEKQRIKDAIDQLAEDTEEVMNDADSGE